MKSGDIEALHTSKKTIRLTVFVYGPELPAESNQLFLRQGLKLSKISRKYIHSI